MTTKRLPDSLKEAIEIQSSSITNDTFIPLFTKSGSTEVMKKIKASVLNNGGGSSTPSAQPDRVIVINTELEENIEGKAYNTFAEAKTYMESINDTYFQVELPAGDFSEPIVIGGNWFIHGNETNLTGLIDTMRFATNLNELGIIEENPKISNCIISGGLTRYDNSDNNSSGFSIPVYIFGDCKILNTGSKIPTSDADCTFVVNYGGFIDADGSQDLFFECFNTVIKRFTTAIAIMNGCTIESFTALTVYAVNCTFSDLNTFKLMNGTEPTGWLTISRKLIVIGCTINTNLKCLGDVISLRNGSYQFNKIAISSNKIDDFSVQNSNFWKGKIVDTSNVDETIESSSIIRCENSIINDYGRIIGGSFGTINISIRNSVLYSASAGYHTVTADANSHVRLSDTIAILNAACNTSVYYFESEPTTNNKPPRYQFADDSTGSNMSTTDEGQSYMGIIKDPTAIKSSQPTNSDYVWIFRKDPGLLL